MPWSLESYVVGIVADGHSLAAWQVTTGGAALLGAIYATWAVWPQRMHDGEQVGSALLVLVTAALVAAFCPPGAHAGAMLCWQRASPTLALLPLRITHSWQAPLRRSLCTPRCGR